MSARGIVAAGHPATAEAARLILREGGNAFDAALAALCAACVCEPVLASLGGGGFLLADDGRRSQVYDFFTHTPKRRRQAAEVDFYPIVADFGGTHQEFHIGMGSIATPGVVRGLFRIHADLASMPLKELIQPAVELARQGVVFNAFQSYIFQVVSPIYTCHPDTLATYASPGRPERLVAEGERLRQPLLADSLEILAHEGERLFHEGEMGRALVENCRQGGGHLTLEDLTGYRVLERRPLQVDYHGVRIRTNPPPSSGGILIGFALRLLEELKSESHAWHSGERLCGLAAVMDQTNRARLENALEDMPETEQAARLLDPALLELYRRRVRGVPAAQRGTTHISVLDRRGRGASLTVSNGEGAGYLIPGTGIVMNNMLGEEDINPHGFNRWPRDRRMSSMMSPTLAHWPDGRTVVTGSGGSNRIRTALLQLLVNLIDHGQALEQAVCSPRIHFERGFLNAEPGFGRSALQALFEAYPEHCLWEDLNLFFGGTHSVAGNAAGDAFEGAGDPRRGGACLTA